MKEVGRKRWKQRKKAQLAADKGEMCLLCFLLSAEAHHVAHRSREGLWHTFEAILDFVTCLVTPVR